ncbi:hypothetical protein OIU78_022020 [Salix suchowensis]|nr:hypothetical protein OIU78_022020 [Salix suchowensis]
MSDVIPQETRTADDIWREIVAGRKEMKDEPDEMMTLEDFLAKAGAVDVVGEDGDDAKMSQSERLSGGLYAFDPVLPSAFQNRESAARSRERKQAYQVELESLAVRLEEENEQLLKEKVIQLALFSA